MAGRPADKLFPSPRPRTGARSGASRSRGSGSVNLPIWGIVAGAVGVAVLILLSFSNKSENVSKTVKVYAGSELPSAVAGIGYSIYWVGREPNTRYELTEISDGRTYVRYLPPGEPAESNSTFTTIGSYQMSDSAGVLKDFGNNPGATLFDAPDGGIALKQADLPASIYVAYPGFDTQVEVYDPRPGRAERLVKDGKVVLVR